MMWRRWDWSLGLTNSRHTHLLSVKAGFGLKPWQWSWVHLDCRTLAEMDMAHSLVGCLSTFKHVLSSIYSAGTVVMVAPISLGCEGSLRPCVCCT